MLVLHTCSAAAHVEDAQLARAPASSAPKWPFEYDWSKFPAAWFGGNATDFESEAQLAEIGKYSLAILGWQHLIFKTNWTASVYVQIEQAAIIKARFPALPVYVYTGFGNADFYNNKTWTIAEPELRSVFLNGRELDVNVRSRPGGHN